MKLFNNKKFNIFSILLVLFILIFASIAFAFWYKYDKINGVIWLRDDASYPKNGWCFIDDNFDGMGSYYYFDEEGRVLVDTITPDYKIVNEKGQMIDNKTGLPITEKNPNLISQDENDEYKIPDEYLRQELRIDGHAVNGTINQLYDPSGPVETLVNDANGSVSKTIIGKNVVFHDDSEYFNPDIDRKVVNHIIGGNNYSKKVNGTIFTKQKWNGVIALKGDGSYFDVKNEQNNFNRIKGRVATHYFTYSDRTTLCTLSIIDVDNEDYLYSTSSFNYNGGVSFDFTFFKTKVNRLRFELSVDGQYLSRVAYIKDLNFSFNREAYKEELDELEEESIIESMYLDAANIGVASDSEIIDEEDMDYEDEVKGNEDYAGPAFDNNLKATSSDTYAPDGTLIRQYIPAKEG